MTDHRLAEAIATYERRTPRSAALWRLAQRWTPLGVHSNHRVVEPYPLYAARASGVTLTDVDSNDNLDFNMAFGALAGGHAHPKVVQAMVDQLARGSVHGYESERAPLLAERLCRRFGMDQVRFSSTGLEATHHAIRIARAVTGHTHVVKFEGAYHGSHDTLLVGVEPGPELAGPADAPRSVPAGPGILPENTERTRVAPYNDLDATRQVIGEVAEDLAAVIVEPVAMSMGVVLPEPGFLPGLRELADQTGAVLIFDEIQTGAKYFHGGAGRTGVHPDLTLLGKSIACGAPLSAIAARSDLLDGVRPGRIAHSGTFNANALAVACGLATLEHILTEESLAHAARLCDRLAVGLRELFRDAAVPAQVVADGPSGTIFFSDAPVRDWRSSRSVDAERSALLFYNCLNRGLLPAGSGANQPWTVSVVHRPDDVDRFLAVVQESVGTLAERPGAPGMQEAV